MIPHFVLNIVQVWSLWCFPGATIKAAPADREKVVKGWILHDVFAFIGFQNVVGVAAVVVVAVAAAAVARDLVSFYCVNRASNGENKKKWFRLSWR